MCPGHLFLNFLDLPLYWERLSVELGRKHCQIEIEICK